MASVEDVTFGYERGPLEHPAAGGDSERIALINLIPKDWCCITGELHAPIEMIRDGSVSAGMIYSISGNTMLNATGPGYGENSISVGRCRQRNQEDSGHFCEVHSEIPVTEVGVGKDQRPMDLVHRGYGPCGVFFDRAGAFNGVDSLEPELGYIASLVSQGYRMMPLSVLSGMVLSHRGRGYHLPTADSLPVDSCSPESISFWNNSGVVRAEVCFRPRLGGERANVEKIIQGLEGLKFKPVSE